MDKVAFSAFGIEIHWYGIIIAFALLVGVVLGVIEAKRRGFRSEMVLDFMLIAIPFLYEWHSGYLHWVRSSSDHSKSSILASGEEPGGGGATAGTTASR